ncbi:MAG: hypothetical protein DCC49_13510 [Acidobacteria bacterium]|nr:MAG: hypothetical protein DCC49_13510 [Acidobacteriota bacterium]
MSESTRALLRSKLHWGGLLVSVMLIASVLTLGIDSSASAATGWNHETLDAGVSTGEGLSTIYWPVYYQHHVFNSGIESSNRVLRHGWYQPGFSNWAFETLDPGNSTGIASATGLWSYQHHVFNTGSESGSPVLRHGWYQPGFSNWAFETLDAGASTGTDTAYAEYSGQQHVFAHGLSPTGQDILRHGYYDLGVGTWIFETLDEGFSEGSALSAMVWRDQLHVFGGVSNRAQGLRHGWFEPGTGWQFETLARDGVESGFSSTYATAAILTPDGRQNVWFSIWTYNGVGNSPHSLGHGWYDESASAWRFEVRPGGDGLGPSVTQYGSHPEVFDYACLKYSPSGPGLFHEFWDGTDWIREVRSASCPKMAVVPIGDPTASATYPPFNQLHAFYAQDPAAMGHFWYDPD